MSLCQASAFADTYWLSFFSVLTSPSRPPFSIASSPLPSRISHVSHPLCAARPSLSPRSRPNPAPPLPASTIAAIAAPFVTGPHLASAVAGIHGSTSSSTAAGMASVPRWHHARKIRPPGLPGNRVQLM
ncbi:hypothetical protein PVAP13_4NG210532 [Panicum virgatum]|uniref:Uncharacterized protein n=1 Tax=Panicum virgatum TaxID=38727 RepID=A0A8T0TB43_PANVG|nr:hypothetical protein PVAP13_4NG210532 [Panicum virgatum]KAG2606455.1 hypothetical protein PVAP13_4NG210532 [Panicum virgatum]